LQQIKSLLVLLLIIAVVFGLFVGIKRLWHKHGVKTRFDEFRDALEMNDLRQMYQFIPPATRTMMPYETFEKEFLDAKNQIKVREVLLDEVELVKDPRRPRALVTFTITQEDKKTRKETKFQLAYEWIKLQGKWFVSLKSIRERYGQYMDEDSSLRRFAE